jgi:N-methylhydantoinase A
MVTGAGDMESDDAPFTENTIRALYAAFVSEHERLYGHRSDKDNLMQVTALRLVGKAQTGAGAIDLNLVASGNPSRDGSASRRAYFGESGGMLDTPVIGRADLNGTLQGPLLIDEYDSTTVVPPQARVSRDEHFNIVMDLA